MDWAEYLQDEKHQYLMGMPEDLEPWMVCDSWDVDTACQLITLACKLDLSKRRRDRDNAVTGPEFSALRSRTICEVYDRAAAIARSSVSAGVIKEYDTPSAWITWAESKGYNVDHLRRRQSNPSSVTEPKQSALEKRIRAIALKFIKDETALVKLGEKRPWQNTRSKKSPGVIAVSTHVEKELKNLDIRGKLDDYLSAETLRRDYLKGITDRRPTGKP